jgi:hypothetical protein
MDMRTVLAVIVLAASALAQGTSLQIAPSCGTKDVKFDVRLDKSRPTLQQTESGKATIYFIQDDGPWGKHQAYVLRIALDGAWVGAYKKNSYFTVSVKPGVHHICANVQSNYSIGSLIALAHFMAESGGTYYFRTRFLSGMNLADIPSYVDLNPLDSDEAKYLITYYPLSVWSAKK